VLAPVKDALRAAAAVAKRPSLTGPARGGVRLASRDEGTAARSNKGTDLVSAHNLGYVSQPTKNLANSTSNVEEAEKISDEIAFVAASPTSRIGQESKS